MILCMIEIIPFSRATRHKCHTPNSVQTLALQYGRVKSLGDTCMLSYSVHVSCWIWCQSPASFGWVGLMTTWKYHDLEVKIKNRIGGKSSSHLKASKSALRGPPSIQLNDSTGIRQQSCSFCCFCRVWPLMNFKLLVPVLLALAVPLAVKRAHIPQHLLGHIALHQGS